MGWRTGKQGESTEKGGMAGGGQRRVSELLGEGTSAPKVNRRKGQIQRFNRNDKEETTKISSGGLQLSISFLPRGVS